MYNPEPDMGQIASHRCAKGRTYLKGSRICRIGNIIGSCSSLESSLGKSMIASNQDDLCCHHDEDSNDAEGLYGIPPLLRRFPISVLHAMLLFCRPIVKPEPHKDFDHNWVSTGSTELDDSRRRLVG